MIHFGFGAPKTQPLKILCLGAHSDDIEIGCGASVLRLAAEYPSAQFHWVVFSAVGVRIPEAQRGFELFVKNAAPGSPILKSDVPSAMRRSSREESPAQSMRTPGSELPCTTTWATP